MTSYDVCVVGAGPGGLSAAIRAAQGGVRVALIDPGPLGGTCLNRGCIPARSMGTTARLVAQLRQAQTFGIQIPGAFQVDLAGVVLRKEQILRRLRAGLTNLVRQSRIDWIQGEAILQGPKELEVAGEKEKAGLRAQAVVLATGSRPASIPGVTVDGKVVMTSDEILDLTRLPASLTVIGAGVVGSEFASYFSDMGVAVTLIEMAPRLLPSVEEAISQAFTQVLKRRGVQVLTGVGVRSVEKKASSGARVLLAQGQVIESEQVLVSTGRTPQLPKGAQGLGLKLREGCLTVDETLRTSVRSIFAVGDLLGEHQLACTASYEGALAAENAIGKAHSVQYRVVPDTIYTEPEIASVGLTEKEAIAQGKGVLVSRLPFIGFARAQTLEETEGFVQVVAERSSGKLLGVQMMGARATDLIGEAALGIQHGITLQQLVETLHGHPTMSESLWEAAATALGQSIYYASPLAA